jgi:hypothetical protein
MAFIKVQVPAVGARIGAVDGPGVFPSDNPGTVIAIHETGFGTDAIVLMDSGKIDYCSGMTNAGIGWHYL